MGNVHCYSKEKNKSKKEKKKKRQPSPEISTQEKIEKNNNKSNQIDHCDQKSIIININQWIINSQSLKLSENNCGLNNYNNIARAALIGKGRFSSIYLGLAKTSGKLVTIKVFNQLSVDKKSQILQQLEFLYQLQHLNIVTAIRVPESQVIGHNESEMSLYYEYSNGVTLESLIKQFGELTEKTILIYVKQICEGLAYLHSLGMVHKNLKASNILVEGNGLIKISDVLIDNTLLGTNQEMIEAMRNYPQIQYSIPPFFLQNIDNKIDYSYDFWCLGCIMIEMATGKKPWSYYSFTNQLEFFDFIKMVQSKYPYLFTSFFIVNPSIPEHLSLSCQSFISLLFDHSLTSHSDIYKKISEHDFLNSVASSEVFPKPEVNSDHQRGLGDKLKKNNIKDAFNKSASFTVSLSVSCSNSILNNNSNIYNIILSSGKEILSDKKKIECVINASIIKEEDGYSIQKMSELCYIK